MDKIHIALVGAQSAPVYNGIYATNPDVVEFVYSDDTENVVERIQKEIGCTVNASSPLSPTDINEIRRRADELAKKYFDCDVTVNITGGTKPWSLFFAAAFSNHPNCRVVYIDQKNILWNLTNLSSDAKNIDVRIDRLFRLYGSTLDSHVDFNDYTEEDDRVCSKIKALRNFNTKEFNGLFVIQDKQTKDLIQRKEGGYDSYSEMSSVDWSLDSNGRKKFEVKIRSNRGVRIETLSSPHVKDMLFNSGWFEYEVAKLFSGWSESKNIWLNCVVRAANKKDLNEIDVIVNTGKKILFVECKTQVHSISDIDKFRSVVKNYGGMGSVGIFITDEIKTDEAKEKCAKNDILDISLKDFRDSKTQKIDVSKFVTFIEKHISKINTR